LRRSGQLNRFIESGGRYLTISNVDNLAAGLDPQSLERTSTAENPRLSNSSRRIRAMWADFRLS